MATSLMQNPPLLNDASDLPAPYDVIRAIKPENPAHAVGHVRRFFAALDTQRRFKFIEGVDNPPQPEVPKTHVTVGYEREVEKLDPNKPHTMDLVNFINLEVSRPIAELLRGGMELQLHMSTPEHCLSTLADKGYTRVHKVITPLGPHMFLAENPEKGETVFAISRIYGMDEVEHYQAIARHLKIPPEQVVTVGYEREYQELISQELRGMPEKPDTWVIGGWIMGKYLEYRAKMGDRHAILMAQWGRYRKEGEPLSKTLMDRLEHPDLGGVEHRKQNRIRAQYARIAGLLRPFFDNPMMEKFLATPSKDMHLDGELCGFAFELTEALDRVGKNNPEVVEIPRQKDGKPFPSAEAPYFRDAITSPSHVSVMRYRNSAGEGKTLAVTDNPYGDISYYLTTEILRSQEPRDIVFVGSSGSIVGMKRDDPIPVGEISVPIEFYDAKGNPVNTTVENQLLAFAEDDIKRDLAERSSRIAEMGTVNEAYMIPTSHVKIQTPLYETLDVVDEWRRGYSDTVDVEAAEVAKAIEEKKGGKPRFAALTYTEDILGLPGHTLGEIDRKLLEKARTKVVDVIVRYLDIREILPTERP
jgi:hypothetical protein